MPVVSESPLERRSFEQNRHGPATRVPSLDALRGLMALSVALYHMSVWTPVLTQGKPLSNAVAVLGVYSVQGFFIISGFCFFHLYRQSELYGRELLGFHLKRFFRIAPLYYLALGLNFVLDQHVGPHFTWPRLFGNLSLTFGLAHPNYAMVLGGWSIGLEYVFYLAFPALLVLTRHVLLRYALTLGLLLAAYPYTFHKVPEASAAHIFHAYVQIPNHAFLFMLGAVLVDLRSLTTWRAPAWLLPGAVALALWALLGQEAAVYDHREIMVGMVRVKYLLGCFALVGTFAFADLDERAWWGLPAWLGKLSYSVYLLHPFAWLIVGALFGSPSPAVSVALGLGLTLGLSALVYRLFEEPLLQLGQTLARRLRKKVESPPVLTGANSQTQAT